MAGRFDQPVIQSWCDVDASKLDGSDAQTHYINVPLSEHNSKGTDKTNYAQDVSLSNKETVRPENFSSVHNFLQTTACNQYGADSNRSQSNSDLFTFPNAIAKNTKCNPVKSGVSLGNSYLDRNFSTAGSGTSDLGNSVGFYLQQYSSAGTDFPTGTTFTGANNFDTSAGFFGNTTTNAEINQLYNLDREIFKDCATTESPTGVGNSSSHLHSTGIINSKYQCNKRLDDTVNKAPSSINNLSQGDYAARWDSYYAKNSSNQELNNLDCQSVSKMSGGPPHHPHGRQAPSPNTAWNHLQVPNYYPRQPQHAHMSNEHPLLHQPTWHTPTTEPVKSMSHSHLFNLEQMITERQYPRHSPGVDLSLQRNGSQNGELPTTPISLSVRDANKINSLPASAIDIQAVELTKSLSPGLKSASPGLKSTSPGLKSASPGLKSGSPVLKPAPPVSPSMKAPISPGISTSPGLHDKQDSPKGIKRPTKRMDSIIERLNPNMEKGDKHIETGVIVNEKFGEQKKPPLHTEKTGQEQQEKLSQSSVIIQPSVTMASIDENNALSITLAPLTVTANTRDEDVTSPFSNEDSTDSSKSRRKRKPSKTVRVSKDTEKMIESESVQSQQQPQPQPQPQPQQQYQQQVTIDCITKSIKVEDEGFDSKAPEDLVKDRKRSGSAPPGSPPPTLTARSRRKTSSESETIANIAAMVSETAATTPVTIGQPETNCSPAVVVTCADNSSESQNNSKPISVSVIKTKENTKSSEGSVDEVTASPLITTVVPTPAQKKAAGTSSFVEVENKLEEMFAGISDDVVEPKVEKMSLDFNEDSKLGLEESKNEDNLLKLEEDDATPSSSQMNDSVTSTSNELNAAQSLYKRGRPKGAKARRSSEGEVSPKRKKGNKKSKQLTDESSIKVKINSKKSKGKNSMLNRQHLLKADVKDVYAYDSGSNASSSKSRGPFIQIRGTRESPISVNIINTPVNDDDSDRKSHKSKKYHDDTEYRHKVKSRGLHCSTLSNKYDAQTRDATWICVFCKRGPHATEPNLSGPSRFNAAVPAAPPPGDLFGPYIITTDSPEYQRRLDDPYDQQFKSKKVARALGAVANNNKSVSKKSKRKHSDSYDSRSSFDGMENPDIYLGITETKDKVYEVWVHEDCIVWSPGVYLVGPKIIGLEEAVWTSCNVVCNKCRYRGANVCCVKRGCVNVMHLGCAAASDWYLDEENYRALCVIHKAP